MATGWGPTAANAALTTLVNTTDGYNWIKLHSTATPGASGTAGAATETDRQEATFGTATGGAITTITSPLIWTSVAGTEDYQWFTAWTASTAGTFGFSGDVTSNSVTAGDTFEIPVGDLDVSLVLAS